MTKKQENNQKAVEFLQSLREGGNHNIVAFHPDTDFQDGITSNDTEALLDFIEEYNGSHNLYFTVNEPHDNAPNGKLAKRHIKNINAVYLDVDPRKDHDLEEERKRLNVLDTKIMSENDPSFIIDSGGGHQVFWKLDKPVEINPKRQDYFEAIGRGLAHKYQGDNVQNVDRLMRLPFTVNCPNEKKRQRGRKPALAKVTYTSDTTYNPKKLSDLAPPITATEKTTKIDTSYDMSSLPDSWDEVPELFDKLQETKLTDGLLNAFYNNKLKKPSRSEFDFLLTQRLKYAGWSLDETATALYLSPHGKGKEITAREITRSYARVDNPFEELRLSNDLVEKINNQTKPTLDQITTSRLDETPTIEHLVNTNKQPSKLQFKSPSQFNWKTNKVPLFKNFLYERSFNVVYGQSNVGKSFVALDIASHLALGKSYHTFKCKKQYCVLYIAAEAGESIGLRLEAVQRRMGFAPNQSVSLKELPIGFIDRPVDYLHSEEDISDTILNIKALENRTNLPCGMVIVDTLATTFGGGNENDSQDMGKFISNMKKIQYYGNSSVTVVHHAGKSEASGARGHSSLRAATDGEFEVTSEQKGSSYERYVKFKKQRDDKSDFKIAFSLNVVTLGHDDDNDPVTTCNVLLQSDAQFKEFITDPSDDLVGNPLLAYNTLLAFENYDIQRGITDELVKWFHHLKKGSSLINLGQTATPETLEYLSDPTNMKSERVILGKCLDKLMEKSIAVKSKNNVWTLL